MINLIFINSPFQLLCAIEAILTFNTQNNVLVIFNKGKGETLNQIQTLLNRYDSVFDSIEYTDRKLESISGWFDGLRFIDELIRKYPIVDNIFVGDYRSGLLRHYCNSVKANKIFLLDDGFATINIQKRLDRKKLYNYKDYVKYCLSRGGYHFKAKKEVSYFTIFDSYIDGKSIYKNSFNNLVSNSEWGKDNSIYWLGSAIVEDGIVEREYYFNRIHQCLQTIKTNQEIIYFPHRREMEEKLQDLKDNFGFKLKFPNLPIEVYIIQERIRPSTIISFYSTALFSLSRMLDCDNIYYILIDENKLLKQRKRIKEIYDILNNEIKNIDQFRF